MAAYYNEIDPYAAQWLRNLIAAGHIAPGDVDERDIRDVRPDDLRGYIQCHFFAGIAVWSSALRLAGWPDDRSVWTGSCPCQPFSAAGKGDGFADERHLWPAWQWLIKERRPSAIFGEQVASKDAESWLDLVSADLEGLGYAFGALAFPSASVGAPHIRDRAYFMAHAAQRGRGKERSHTGGIAMRDSAQGIAARLIDGCMSGVMADASDQRLNGRWPVEARDGRDATRVESERFCATGGYWANADWIECLDGRWRPVEPGTFPLAHGATSRVGRLRAYGNAINREAAATFIAAARETIDA